VAVTADSCRFFPGDEELGVISTRLRVSLANPLVWAYQADWKKKKCSHKHKQKTDPSTTNLCQEFYLFDFFSSSVFNFFFTGSFRARQALIITALKINFSSTRDFFLYWCLISYQALL